MIPFPRENATHVRFDGLVTQLWVSVRSKSSQDPTRTEMYSLCTKPNTRIKGNENVSFSIKSLTRYVVLIQ